jgi:hypothetical protein
MSSIKGEPKFNTTIIEGTISGPSGPTYQGVDKKETNSSGSQKTLHGQVVLRSEKMTGRPRALLMFCWLAQMIKLLCLARRLRDSPSRGWLCSTVPNSGFDGFLIITIFC